jgi:hypothetical protein
MKNLFFVFLIIICGSCRTQAQQSPQGNVMATMPDFQTLLARIEGEFDNLVQTQKDPKASRMHVSIRKVSVPALAEHVYFVQYLRNNDPKNVYRQRLIVFQSTESEITSEAFSFLKDSLYSDFGTNTKKQLSLNRNEVKSSLGCPSKWILINNDMVGKADACAYFSAKRGKNIFIYDRMKISASGMATSEAAKDENGMLLFGDLDGWALVLDRQ